MWRSKYVAAGVRTDSDKLLQKFIENGTLDYPEFARFWRDMNFSLIFMGRITSRELIEFQAECFRIAKMYWDPKYCFSYHVGGFFLLYGFYKKQLMKPPQKIRMEMEEWKFLISLMKYCKERKMLDVNYLFYTLCRENAFHFVYNVKMFGPKISLTESDTIEREARWKEILMPLDTLAADGELDQISTIHEKYQKLKEGFDQNTSNSLLLIKDNVANDTLSEVKKFMDGINENVYKTKSNKTNTKNKEQMKCESSEEQTIGEHRAYLRNKTFSGDLSFSRHSVIEGKKNKGTCKRSRYSYQNDTESNSDD